MTNPYFINPVIFPDIFLTTSGICLEISDITVNPNKPDVKYNPDTTIEFKSNLKTSIIVRTT